MHTRTRTVEQPREISQASITPEAIEKTVDERGFYLYEWISSDELQMTLERDYLTIVRWSSIPLAIVTAIAGLIGFGGGIIGTIALILLVLGVFYAVVFIGLFLNFLRRAYIYTRGAQVVITDNHYVSSGKILEKSDRARIQSETEKIGNMFDEPFLGTSGLAQRKEHAKTKLFENLKEIAFGGGKILKSMGNSKNSGGIVIVILLAGLLYGVMMGAVYFIGVFFIALFGRLFSWIAHRYLLATNNTEHHIQSLFSSLDREAKDLEGGKSTTLSLLDEAGRNAWKENLLGKINESITLLSDTAGRATDESRELKKLLESSKYRDIFNFVKYGNWIKKQILEPIESILLLLEKNHAILMDTIDSLSEQIRETSDPSLRNPLELQKNRLILQKESFERNIELLRQYQEKLR